MGGGVTEKARLADLKIGRYSEYQFSKISYSLLAWKWRECYGLGAKTTARGRAVDKG